MDSQKQPGALSQAPENIGGGNFGHLIHREGYDQLVMDNIVDVATFIDASIGFANVGRTPVAGMFNEIPVVVLPDDEHEAVETRWKLASALKAALYEEQQALVGEEPEEQVES